MSRIFTCPCCLNGFKHCRKYLEVFSKEEIRKTPTFAAAEAVIQAIYGNLEKAEKYASYVGDERLMKLHLDVIIPGTDRERARAAFLKLAEIYNNYGILPNLPLAAGRITMINGFRDMTMYGDYVHDRKEQLKGWVKSFYGDSSLGIAEITYAEVCYQRDECFEAITTLVGIIPFIEKEGEIAVLFIALSLQMRIMIATGQIAVVYPILEEIYQRLHKEQSRWLLENFGAMKAWGLMYDGDVDTVTEWMENEAPSEFGELNMLDTYKYMIKMRAYILEEKYLALLYPDYLRKAKEDYPPLTKSEQEILRLMADERSNQEIADFMGISINTVKFHGKNIFAKLRVRTRRQAVRVAKENRLLSLK